MDHTSPPRRLRAHFRRSWEAIARQWAYVTSVLSPLASGGPLGSRRVASSPFAFWGEPVDDLAPPAISAGRGAHLARSEVAAQSRRDSREDRPHDERRRRGADSLAAAQRPVASGDTAAAAAPRSFGPATPEHRAIRALLADAPVHEVDDSRLRRTLAALAVAASDRVAGELLASRDSFASAVGNADGEEAWLGPAGRQRRQTSDAVSARRDRAWRELAEAQAELGASVNELRRRPSSWSD